jgi:hypothetical protein
MRCVLEQFLTYSQRTLSSVKRIRERERERESYPFKESTLDRSAMPTIYLIKSSFSRNGNPPSVDPMLPWQTNKTPSGSKPVFDLSATLACLNKVYLPQPTEGTWVRWWWPDLWILHNAHECNEHNLQSDPSSLATHSLPLSLLTRHKNEVLKCSWPDYQNKRNSTNTWAHIIVPLVLIPFIQTWSLTYSSCSSASLSNLPSSEK